MKIEKVNDNQIRCTLTREDLDERQLKISEIHEVIPSFAREVLLRWIANANMVESRSGMTEFGNTYHLGKEEGTCVLHCEDGDLTMPCYVLTFAS